MNAEEIAKIKGHRIRPVSRTRSCGFALVLLSCALSPVWGKGNSHSSSDWNESSFHESLWGDQGFEINCPSLSGGSRYSDYGATHCDTEESHHYSRDNSCASNDSCGKQWLAGTSWDVPSFATCDNSSSSKDSKNKDSWDSKGSGGEGHSDSGSWNNSPPASHSSDDSNRQNSHSWDSHSSGSSGNDDRDYSQDSSNNDGRGNSHGGSNDNDHGFSHGGSYDSGSTCNPSPCGSMNCPPQAVPEPGSAALLASLAAVGLLRRRRQAVQAGM